MLPNNAGDTQLRQRATGTDVHGNALTDDAVMEQQAGNWVQMCTLHMVAGDGADGVAACTACRQL